MKLKKRTNYPPYILEASDNVVLRDSNGNPLMRVHQFDNIELGICAKKWRKDDINFGNKPVWGTLPLRYLYYRTNEAQIPAVTRMGLQ